MTQHPAQTSALTAVAAAPQIRPSRKTTGYVFDVNMSYHVNQIDDEEHPEDPKRILRIHEALRVAGCLDRCDRISSREVTREETLLVHSEEHWRKMSDTLEMDLEDLRTLSHDYNSVYLNAYSFTSAKLACGSVIELCKAVIEGRVENGIAIVRPPGHHAEKELAMGFCVFNNVAVATKVLQREDSRRKIMILDWDVHYGNGIQKAFADDPKVLYVSLHRYEEGDFFPNDVSGAIESVGIGRGQGRTVNIAWPCPGMDDADYLYAFEQVVMKVGQEFGPDLVIVSAGFDAADGDELGECHVTPAGYAQMTHCLKGLAGGKLVLALEGGYNLDAISSSALACTRVLLGEPPDPVKTTWTDEDHEICRDTVALVTSAHRDYWSCLRKPPVVDNDKAVLAEKEIIVSLEEILKIYRAQTTFGKYGLVNLPISDDSLQEHFDDHILFSKEMFAKKTIFVFVHPPPEIRLKKRLSGEVDLSSSGLFDAPRLYVDAIVKAGHGLIDVEVPFQKFKLETHKLANEVIGYLWENYLAVSNAANIVFIAAGQGASGVIELLSKQDVLLKTVCTVVIAEPNEVPQVTGSIAEWYYNASFVVVPSVSTVPVDSNRAYGNCMLSDHDSVLENLCKFHENIIQYVSKMLAARVAPIVLS